MTKVQEEPQDSGEQFSKLSRMSGTTLLLETWREHCMNKIDLQLSVTMCMFTLLPKIVISLHTCLCMYYIFCIMMEFPHMVEY